MQLRHVEGDLWEIPRQGRMRVPGRVYCVGPPAPDDPALQQVANVAHLPGILRFSLAMPDIHWGYGFPIGGVGYDINCGVRVITTALEEEAVRANLHAVTAQLYRDIPTGVGASQAIPRLSPAELDEVFSQGARWAVKRGFMAASDDAERCEEGGRLAGADPLAVSERAMRDTFGSSCHGAGRLLSRSEALRRGRGRSIGRELAARGIEVISRGKKTLAEEMSEAYKDVAQVVAVVERAGLSRLVARLEPMGVIKG
jgi:RNA-splicing ligase RtcB